MKLKEWRIIDNNLTGKTGYKYKEKEISVLTEGDYFKDKRFSDMEDGIRWLMNEFGFTTPEEFREKKHQILFKNQKQPKYTRLFITTKELEELNEK